MVSSELEIVARARDQLGDLLPKINKELKNMESVLGKTGGAMGTANKRAGDLQGTLGSVRAASEKARGGLGGLVDTLGKLGLAGMGISALAGAARGLGDALGIGLNVEMENVEASLVAFTKDGAKAKEILAQIRKEADSTPFAFNEMAKATAGLMPVAKTSGAALMDLVKQAEILAASNPAQGLEGAAFALREAVSGDFTSVIERFNLPRSYIKKLKEEGVPDLEIVSRAMLEMGYDSDLVSNLAKTASGRWSTFMDTIDGVKAKVSAVVFDKIKDALGNMQSWFDANKGNIDEWANDVGALLGGAISSAVTLFGNLAGALAAVGQYFIVVAKDGDYLNDFLADVPAPLQGIVQAIGRGVAIFRDLVAVFQGARGAGLDLHNALERLLGLEAANFVIDLVKGAQALHANLGPLVDQGIVRLQQAMADLAPTGERLSKLFDAIKSAVIALVPKPLLDVVSGLGDMARKSVASGDVLKTLTDVVNTVSRAIENASEFVRDHKEVQAVLVGILGAAATAWTLIKVVTLAQAAATGIVTTVTGAWTAAQWLLNAALTANPIGIVVVALAGLAAALIYAYNNSEDFRNIVDGALRAVGDAFNWLLGAAQTTLDWLGAAFAAIGPTIIIAMDNIDSAIRATWSNITKTIQSVLESIGGAITGAWNGIKATASAIWTGIQNVIQGIQDAIRNKIQSVWNAIPEDIRADLALIAGELARRFNQFLADAKAWLDATKTKIATTWGDILAAISTVLTAIRDNVIAPILNAISGILSATWAAISTTASNTWEGLKGIIAAKLTATRDAVVAPAVNGANSIKSVLEGAWAAINAAVTTAWEAVKTTIMGKLDAATGALSVVMKFVGDVLGSLSGLASDALSKAQEIGNAIIQGITNGINAGWQALKDLVGNLARELLKKAKDVLDISSPSKEFFRVGQFIIDGLVAGLKSRNTTLIDAITSTVGNSINLMEGLISRKVGGLNASILSRGASAAENFQKLLAEKFDGLDIMFGFPNLPGIFSQISAASKDAAMVGQIKDVLDAMREMGLTIDGNVIQQFKNLGQELGGPFKEQLDKLLGSLGEQDALKGLKDFLADADLGRQLAATASQLQSLGQAMPDTLKKLLESVPRVGGGILDTIIKQLLAGAIPGFASGGVVPGPANQPALAVVHGGERITPAGGPSGNTYHFNMTVNSQAPADSTIANFALMRAMVGG